MAEHVNGLIIDRQDGVVVVTMDRPKQLNALSNPMRDEIVRFFTDANKDPSVRVIVITGSGDRAFCAGADVTLLPTMTGAPFKPDMRLPLGYWAVPIYKCEKPIIAAVNGIAAGGGFSIALIADVRIASDRARFSSVWVKRGLIPDAGATYLLPQRIGWANAAELSFTGRVLNADEALKMGIVSRVVPHDKLMDTAMEMARQMASMAPISIMLTKRAFQKAAQSNFETQILIESEGQMTCWLTEDHKEGTQSFLEKREPKFQGK
ncbi:MAG: enoyl-CoA hydratase/isomerase family protein [Dehalococcoidia bacterium]|nr:enoyl-CoA hydratase/isomerase family protein [Dehalococcoidia bacterium]